MKIVMGYPESQNAANYDQPEYRLGELGEIDLWREHLVVRRFEEITGDTGVLDRAEATCSVLLDFIGTGVGRNMYAAAMLREVVSRIDDVNQGAVVSGLLRPYSELLHPDEWAKIGHYCSDVRPLQKFVDQERVRADALLPQKRDRSRRKGQPSEHQKSLLGRVGADNLDGFLQTVNIESAIIGAAASLAVLLHPEKADDQHYYQALREIRHFGKPISYMAK